VPEIILPGGMSNSSSGDHCRADITCRRAIDGDFKHGAESHHIAHKIEFPMYDGISDSLSWLNRCERYF
jgi:hypothetical protein